MEITNYLLSLTIEAVSIGFILLIISHILSFFMNKSKQWNTFNKSHSKLIFLSGVILHLFLEFSELHTWYIKNGAVHKNM